MRLTLKFAYDGKKYQGYARQPQLKTVEGEIIKALIKQGFIEDTKESYFRFASRTDKGVSALGNVIAFNTKASKRSIIKELNDELTDMLFYGIKDVDQDFFPRYAQYRIYRYYLKNMNLKMDKILSAAGAFTGTYNFSNFAKLEKFKDPIRTINNIIVTNNDLRDPVFHWESDGGIQQTVHMNNCYWDVDDGDVQLGLPWDSGEIVADPLFVDFDGGDFRGI